MKEEEWVIVHTAAFPRIRYTEVLPTRQIASMDAIQFTITGIDKSSTGNDMQAYQSLIDKRYNQALLGNVKLFDIVLNNEIEAALENLP